MTKASEPFWLLKQYLNSTLEGKILFAQTGDDLDFWGFTLWPIGSAMPTMSTALYSTNIYQGVGVVVP